MYGPIPPASDHLTDGLELINNLFNLRGVPSSQLCTSMGVYFEVENSHQLLSDE